MLWLVVFWILCLVISCFDSFLVYIDRTKYQFCFLAPIIERLWSTVPSSTEIPRPWAFPPWRDNWTERERMWSCAWRYCRAANKLISTSKRWQVGHFEIVNWWARIHWNPNVSKHIDRAQKNEDPSIYNLNQKKHLDHKVQCPNLWLMVSNLAYCHICLRSSIELKSRFLGNESKQMLLQNSATQIKPLPINNAIINQPH